MLVHATTRDATTRDAQNLLALCEHKTGRARVAMHNDARPDTFVSEANATLRQLGAPLEVRRVRGSGCGLFATEDVAAGAVLLSERPFALTVSHSQRRHVCAFCLADRRNHAFGWPIVCACGALHFCSEGCAKAAACGGHHDAVECALLRAAGLASDSHDPTIDLVLQAIRILSHRAAGRRVTPFDACALSVGADSYAGRLCGFVRTRETSEVLRRAAATALRLAPKQLQVPASELQALLDRHQANVFGVIGRGGDELALASW